MKVCFVAQGVYSYLSPDASIMRAGGAELQQVQIATGLGRLGIQVSYIVLDHGQPDHEVVDRFTLYKTYRENEGIPGVRFLYPRAWKTWLALVRADADVYYCRAAGYLPALLALYCRRYGKKFIFAGAHDTDFMPGAELIPTARDKVLYRLGLRHASAVIVQSERQQSLLLKNYGIKGTLIRNFFMAAPLERNGANPRSILWVSTLREWKRPFLFIKLASRFPNEQFIMIGGPDSDAPKLYEEVAAHCRQQDNLKFLGFQPLDVTELYFDQSKLFINTSLYEGFPNTFLQAWRRGIPVISFVDPDGVITKNNLGAAVDNEEEMADRVGEFLSSKSFDSDQIKNYFRKEHSAGVVERYRYLLESVISGPDPTDIKTF